MGVSEILAQIDREIIRLRQARALLSGTYSSTAPRATTKKRTLTPEGRKRIVEAVRRRWAEQKKVKPLKLTA